MDVEFDDEDLDRIEIEAAFTGGFSDTVVRGFRKVLQALRAARDERDLYNSKGLRYEKLKGNRQHQHSLRLNDKWRLIVELRVDNNTKVVRVIEICDYH